MPSVCKNWMSADAISTVTWISGMDLRPDMSTSGACRGSKIPCYKKQESLQRPDARPVLAYQANHREAPSSYGC